MPNTKSVGVAFSDPALSGGTLDDMAIGATTPSTGAFTTLSATGSVALGNASTDLIGFYGTTAVDQAATIASVTTTGASSTTNAYGFTTAAQADAIVTSLNSVLVALTDLGLVASA